MKAFKRAAMGAMLIFCLAAVADVAHATQTFMVNSTLDEPDDDVTDEICHTASGTCTLRAAINQANHAPVDVVIILPAGTFLLTLPAVGSDDEFSGDLNLNNLGANPSLEIAGSPSSSTIIDGNGTDRVFNIAAGQNVGMSYLTIRNGNAAGDAGGGIVNSGVLSLDNVVITNNNSSVFGGGIWSDGELYLLRTSVLHNHSDSYAGGIFSNNVSVIDSCTIAYNDAAEGGGLVNDGSLRMTNSTVAANLAISDGGGIFQIGSNSVANVYNTTIAYNEADSNADGKGTGGGLSADQGSFNVYNSIVAGNTRLQAGIEDNCAGSITTHAFNRFGINFQCDISQASGAYATLNTDGGSYLIGPLANNGGSTQTIALLLGSNAIDGGAQNCLDAFSQTISKDQREFTRNVGKCDIGAYEYGAINPYDVIFQSGFE